MFSVVVCVPSRLMFAHRASPRVNSKPSSVGSLSSQLIGTSSRTARCTLQRAPARPECRCGPASGSRLRSPWTQSPRTRVIPTILDAPEDPTDMGKRKFRLGIMQMFAVLLHVSSLLSLHVFIFIKIIVRFSIFSGLNLGAVVSAWMSFHPLPPSTCPHVPGLFAGSVRVELQLLQAH